MRLGAYQLIRQIGAGGMGEVWIAERKGPGGQSESVAIKRLPRRLAGDPSYRRILLEEARLSQLLSHPNIVHTIDAGEAEGEVYIAMELIDGLDLSRINKILGAHGERLSIPVAAYVIAEILRGLAYAHNLEHEGELISLVHRDVSPHNVMLSTTGAIKLTDFGVARLSSEDTSGTHVKGKARYMPPEQLRGESRSPSVDLFAAGAVLQELLDGSLFRGAAIDDARLLGMAIDGLVPAPKHPRDIPPELELLRSRLLAADPEQRPRSAERALDLLYRWDGYRDRPGEVAELVTRLRVHEAELASGATQTGLAHQATFLHTNELELDESELAELGKLVEGPDQILLALADEHTRGTPGPTHELDRTNGSSGAAATGGHASPSRDPSLALDLSDASFVGSIPTGPNPIVPARRGVARLGLGLGLIAILGVGGWVTARELDWLPSGEGPPPIPETSLRRATVASRGSVLDLGLRDRKLDALVAEGILFNYVVDPSADPLAALRKGEAAFALTSVAAFSRDAGQADPSGQIVAVIGLQLANEALVLDTVGHPKLRELADLRTFEGPNVLAHTRASEPLVDALTRGLGPVGTEQTRLELEDDAAVFARLQGDDPSVVAGVLHEPWISKAKAQGMSVALTGLDLPRAHVEVLVASAQILETDPELVEAVVAAYTSTLRAAQAEPTVYIDRLAAAKGLTHAEAEQVLAGLCMFDDPKAVEWISADTHAKLDACRTATPARLERAQALGPLPGLELDAALFEPGKATLHGPGTAIVADLASRLKALNPATISAEIIGFGDRSGNAGRKLGKARAQQVIKALRSANVTLELEPTGHDKRRAPASRLQIQLSRGP